MKPVKFFTVCIVLITVLFAASCGGISGISGVSKTFESKLRGVWVSNDPNLYSGELIIDFNTITIKGYGEDWLSIVSDDSKRPFRDYPKNVSFKGYSEDSKIFIEYREAEQNGIPYYYYETSSYPNDKILEFNFGGRREILQYQADY